MLQLIYVSRAVATPTPEELRVLVEVARERNAEDGLTGVLVYADSSYLQVLEGDADRVDATYKRIQRDRRHRDLRLLACEPVADRSFGTWAMAYHHPDASALTAALPDWTTAIEQPLASQALIGDVTAAEDLLRRLATPRPVATEDQLTGCGGEGSCWGTSPSPRR